MRTRKNRNEISVRKWKEGERMIKFEHLEKRFKSKGSDVYAVRDANFEIKQGEIFGIIGFSGAGKSTLVRMINLLEEPTDGKVYFDGTDLTSISGKELRKVRQRIGMIFQQFNLLAQRNVIDNVCYPLEISGKSKKEARVRAKELLELVGIADKEKAYPAQLSGGQKQRVAIARALATNPDVLLCDEATSALDPITTKSILELLKEINSKLGVTVVIITHSMEVVEQICDRVAVMSEGVIEEIGAVKDIFLNPKSETAKRLVLPYENQLRLDESVVKPENVLRIAFDGQSSFKPFISSLTIETNAYINIVGANTENIGGKAYGQMLIELPDDKEKQRAVKEYLKKEGVHYE